MEQTNESSPSAGAKPRAYVEERSQPSTGKWPRSGPDTYVAVQIVPPGAEALKSLNESVARKRGIEIRYIGEGYSEHRGPRSMLGRAHAAAERIAAEINEEA